MSRLSDSERPARRLIDAEAKALFVADLRAGIARDEAARGRGFSAEAFYCARKRDALFRFAWIWALELSAVDEREARRAASLAAAAAGDPIAPNNLRPVQRRRMRGIKFTDERKRLFLDHYAGTADAFAAADAAGIHYSTFHKHYRSDPEFAAACAEALAFAYGQLEAEALRQRLEAQRGLREGRIPKGEMAQEFDRVMKLLDRSRRRDGRIGVREVRHGRQKRWTFEEAIEALDRKLRALGVRHGIEDCGS
jgi:hypothetical protein